MMHGASVTRGRVVRGRTISLLQGKVAEDFGPTSVLGTESARTDDMFLLPSAWTYEAGLPEEARILRFWASAVPVLSGTCANIVCSFSPRYGSEESVSIAECYASTFGSTDRPEGP